jgi:hypothetical protein
MEKSYQRGTVGQRHSLSETDKTMHDVISFIFPPTHYISVLFDLTGVDIRAGPELYVLRRGGPINFSFEDFKK